MHFLKAMIQILVGISLFYPCLPTHQHAYYPQQLNIIILLCHNYQNNQLRAEY